MAIAPSSQLVAVARRLLTLQADDRPRWGRMSAHQMVCHLADALRVAEGSKSAASRANWFTRKVMKHFALRTRLRPPRGIRAPAEVDQLQNGTPPTTYEDDLAEVLWLVERFRALPPDHSCGPHPLFGPLTREEWTIFHSKHLDHHLRQFGR